MRIITDHVDYEIFSLVQAVKKDRNSWEGWYGLKIDFPAGLQGKAWPALQGGIRHILDIYLDDKQGSIFWEGAQTIHIFCKDIQNGILQTLGGQILDLVAQESGQAAHYSLFDIRRDYHSFIDIYDRGLPKYSAAEDACSAIDEPVCSFPEIQDICSDKGIHLSDRKVLLVEDDPVTRWMVRASLKDECLLATATDSGKAIDLYRTYKPDMVLLDINLPGKSGRDVIARLIHMDPGAHIVMFSSHDSLENIVGTIEDGAKGFIAKPFSKEKLLQYVHDCPAVR
ncbi:MAG: response regulator transcription factor [Rhodospirillales bacterium]|nr:response regulator transcription factor [Rhodospirillales bacterium]